MGVAMSLVPGTAPAPRLWGQQRNSAVSLSVILTIIQTTRSQTATVKTRAKVSRDISPDYIRWSYL